MPLSRDHHVVPQFYLRRFADAARRTRQLSRANRVGTLVAVKRATVELDLYNTVDRDGTFNSGWEEVLSYIESQAAPALAAVIEGTWPLDDGSRERVANWLAAQYIRTPRFRLLLDIDFEELRARVSNGGVDSIREIFDAPELSDDALLEYWAQAETIYPRNDYQDANSHIGWFSSFLGGTARQLYERAWLLTRFTRPALLTADNALVPVAANEEEPHPMDPGAATVFSIALDRHNLLQLIKRPDTRDGLGAPSQELAFMANAMAISHAHRFVYQHPDDNFAEPIWDIPM